MLALPPLETTEPDASAPSDVAVDGVAVRWRRFTRSARGALQRAVSPDTLRSPLLPVIAIVALGIGAFGTIVNGVQSREVLLGVLAAASTVAWAGIRLLLMRLVERHDPQLVLGAWALSAMVFSIGWTPDLRLFAWVVSAGVCFAALAWEGTSPWRAARVVGVAWGAQALVVAAVSIARSGIVFFGSRGGR